MEDRGAKAGRLGGGRGATHHAMRSAVQPPRGSTTLTSMSSGWAASCCRTTTTDPSFSRARAHHDSIRAAPHAASGARSIGRRPVADTDVGFGRPRRIIFSAARSSGEGRSVHEPQESRKSMSGKEFFSRFEEEEGGGKEGFRATVRTVRTLRGGRCVLRVQVGDTWTYQDREHRVCSRSQVRAP